MRRHVLGVVLVIVSLLTIGLGQRVQLARAQGAIEVVDESTASNFRHSFTFNMKVQSTAGKIVKANLIWQARRTDDNVSQSVKIDQPASEVALQYVWNTTQITTPPWQPVTYHWELTDDAGNVLTTPEVRSEITDTSHNWQKLSDDKVSVYYYDQSDAFGKQLLDVAQKGYARVVETTGYTPTGDLRVVMYNNEKDFCSFWADNQCADWIAGVTFGSVTVEWLDPTQESFVMRQVVPHELSHAFLNNWLGPRIKAVPRWFNEGQAVNNELQGVSDELQTARQLALTYNLQRLAVMDTFPTTGRTTSIRVANWYSESTSLVYYLYQEYGVDSLGRVLNKIKDGESFNQAMQEVTGLNMSDYEVAWRQWIGAN